MPTYEYACTACNYEFEVEQSIKEDALKECPKCRLRFLRRLISKSSFQLKGSGWAVDNYSSNRSSG